MSTESSYHLQQSLYTLYRNYYHSGCVTLLYNKDFTDGTFQIKKGGLYVMCEDIIFNPDEINLTTDTKYTSNKAYRMGFFAAITVECDDVVIDLQGHTIRQSYEHYFKQRFFSVIELGSSPFISEQGPALVNQKATEYPYMSSSNCMIINGTIGLSSHGGIHGNNNTNILLQQLTIQDFETTGIQLNGVKKTFIDCATIKGITVAPVNSLTFTLLQHKKKLEQIISDTPEIEDYILSIDASNNVILSHTDTLTDVCRIENALIQPFKDADLIHVSQGGQTTVAATLRSIWVKIKAITGIFNHIGDSLDAQIKHFATTESTHTQTGETVGCPDGSVIHGILIHQSGVAIGELTDACATQGGPCCPVAHSTSKCSKNAESVTIHNCTISNLLLNSHETCGLFDTTSKKFIRDYTSAVLDCETVFPGGVLSIIRVLVNQSKTTKWPSAVQKLLIFGREMYSWDTFLTDMSTVEFRFNIDIMAHISKGTFGIRVEDVTGLSIENVTYSDSQNLSAVQYPRKALPKSAVVKSQIVSSLMDQVSDYAFGGADSRGIFLGNCKGYLLTQITLKNLYSVMGLSQGVDIGLCHNGNLHGLHTSQLIGIISDTLRVHDNCSRLYLREVHSEQKQTKSYRALLEDVLAVVDTIDNTSTNVEKETAYQKLTSLIRLPYVDNHLLAFETPSSITQLQLC